MAYNYDSVPDDLKKLPQWVVWKKETDEKGKVKKVPRNPITGYGASSTNPETWNTFETVKGVYETAGTYDGIGFVFNNGGIVGIDLDHCIDETGQMTETAQEIIQVLDSYTEYSPSGTGVHIYAYGTLPVDGRKREPYEMYQNKRYFTVTGQSFHNPPKSIQYKGPEILKIFERLFPQVESPAPAPQPVSGFSVLNADEVINRIRASRQGQAFEALYQGDVSAHLSQSEADLALCNMLAFWCAKDAQMMDIIFRQSGLYRPKWDVKHGPDTYGNITLQKAIAGTTDAYTPRKEMYGHEVVTTGCAENSADPQAPAVPKKLVKSSEIEAQEKRWLLYPYFQEYKLGLIVGEAGSCKTQFTLKLAAFFTSGKLFWNENPLEERKPLKIIYLSGEDAVDDTLKPRFAAMGGNEENMFFLDNGTSYEPLTIYSPELIGFIEEVHPDIIMFDPLQGYYEKGANANDGVQIRKQAMYLTALAERYKFTPIGIMHPNKNDMMKAADRVSGSKEIVNVARTALYLGKDPENEERVNVAMSKWNGPIGDGFSFRLEKLGFDDHGHSVIGDLIYEGPCNKSADQIASGAIPRERTAPAVDALTEMLQEMLRESNGQVIVSEAKAAAKEMGFNYSSLQRAKQNLGLKFDRVEINRKKVNMWIEPEETKEHDTS